MRRLLFACLAVVCALPACSGESAPSSQSNDDTASSSILISEIRTRGAAGGDDELVELYNAGEGAFTFDGTWTVSARSAVGACGSAKETVRFRPTGTIPAHGHLLAAGKRYAGSTAPDVSYSTGIPDAASVVLRHGADVVDAACFGYDAATTTSLTSCAQPYVCSGSPASNLPHDNSSRKASNADVSLERGPGGADGNGTNTRDNAHDFLSNQPSSPQDLASPPMPDDGPAGCHHQCATWGVRCNGDVLETCVEDAGGCRKLLAQTCALGCSGEACHTCSSYVDPAIDAVHDDESGYYRDVVLHKKTAIAAWNERDGEYAGSGWGTAAVNVTRPAALTSPAPVTLTSAGYVSNLQLSGDHLFYLDRPGLQVSDVKSPSAPKPLATLALGPATNRGLSVSGNLACVAADDGLHLVDISQPSAPRQVGLYSQGVTPYQVRCAAGRAAIAGPSAGGGYKVQIVSVTTPAQPLLLAEAAAGNVTYGDATMQFDGATVFAVSYAAYDEQLWYAIDAYRYDAGKLAKAGSLGQLSLVRATALSNETLFVGHDESVSVIDVSDPAAMSWRKRAYTPAGTWGMAFDGTHLYGTGNGLASYDLDRMPDYAPIAARSGDDLGGAAVSGAIAVLARASGLVIEDVRDPRAPVVMSRIAMKATDVATSGSLAYVTVEDGIRTRLEIFDITSPWAPFLLGSVDGPGPYDGTAHLGSLKLSTGRAIARCGPGYLCIFDVHDPTHPTLLTESHVNTDTVGSSAWGRVFGYENERLYLPGDKKLFVVDLHDPLAPKTIGTVALPSYDARFAVEVADGHVYVANSCGYPERHVCFFVVDVADPKAPKLVGSTTHDIAFQKELYTVRDDHPVFDTLRAFGGRIYLSSEWGGVLAVDVSKPEAPRFLTEYWTALPAREFFAVERFLTAFTTSAFPYPAPVGQLDQVIDLCP